MKNNTIAIALASLLVGGGILLHNTPFYCVRAL